MRQIFVRVPRGHGPRVLDAARRCGGHNLSVAEATDERGEPVDLAVVHVANAGVGPLFTALGDLPDLRVSMIPSGAPARRIAVTAHRRPSPRCTGAWASIPQNCDREVRS